VPPTSPETADLTPNEVAALAEVAPRTVRKAIEEGVLRPRVARLAAFGRERRQALDADAVVYMAALREIGMPLPVETKRRIAERLRKRPPGRFAGQLPIRGVLTLDLARLGPKIRQAAVRALRYRRDRDRWIVRDPGILGGTPVIKGTRISVYSVLGRVEGHDTIDEIAEENYDVPRQAFEAAVVYARANPFRGRPGGRPWRKES
jgi:uncharacterized protein (DUF433 family)